MASILFPHQQSRGQVICLRPREVIILGLGGILGVYILFSGIPPVLRTGMFVMLIGTALMLALGRDPEIGVTLETKVSITLRGFARRGDQTLPATNTAAGSVGGAEIDVSSATPVDIGLVLQFGLAKGDIWVTPIPITIWNLLWIPVSTLLFMGLIWVWGGGL